MLVVVDVTHLVDAGRVGDRPLGCVEVRVTLEGSQRVVAILDA
jgi:hypothetical protein